MLLLMLHGRQVFRAGSGQIANLARGAEGGCAGVLMASFGHEVLLTSKVGLSAAWHCMAWRRMPSFFLSVFYISCMLRHTNLIMALMVRVPLLMRSLCVSQ